MDEMPTVETTLPFSDFEREYFIQTRKEIDTEKQERNKILHYAFLAIGITSLVLVKSEGGIDLLMSKQAFVVYFPILVMITILVATRRMKLRQISDRWFTLLSMLETRRDTPSWVSLELIVCRGLSGTRYIIKDLMLHLCLCTILYSLIITVIINIWPTSQQRSLDCILPASLVFLHFVLTTIWLAQPLTIPLEHKRTVDDFRKMRRLPNTSCRE